ncbi:MAG: diguanylate cyclase [Spirochaetae bacterium HGW-Spirochaetae-8]|nr:MAG: diguanylate cyclase [Spirochaetae bacterium HGW-Spirochaetae-8]
MADRTLKILTIDDNSDNLVTVQVLIKEKFPNAIVLQAATGQHGLELAAFEDPDVILLDVVMPGMDGFEVCRRLKANKALCDIPVVFLTAIRGEKQHRIRALECGAEAFLAKPIDENELTAQIRAMVKIKTAVIEKRSEKRRLAQLVEERTYELKATKDYLEKLIGYAKAPIVVWDENYLATRCNEAFENLCGRPSSALIGHDVRPLLTTEGRDRLEAILSLQDSYHASELNVIHTDGTLRTVLWNFATLYDPKGINPVSTIAQGQDITDRKRTEKELLYLSNHDYLTGLYNRRFYENELKRLDTVENLPLSIIMADINGLKMINDSFGYAKGDDLLKAAAEVISKGCRSSDVVARFGGDEFIILLPKTTAEKTEEIVKSIKKASTEFCMEEIPLSLSLSLSFGFKTKTSYDQALAELLRLVEDDMYRHKIFETSSDRSKTIDLIMNTLFEKSRREMLHSQRVSELCAEIATRMGFTKDAINQVRTAGLMHDIGKIGIAEKILNKSFSLDEDEWQEIQKHPEIGYRILSSVNEFSEMSAHILQHHERWDGKGYPKGLKGEEIYLEARIIAVADSYDAMTSHRSYREGLQKEQAMSEILRCSGTQFDPQIVTVFISLLAEDTITS